MQEICSSKPPVITGICDPNKSQARHHRSLKIGSKLTYITIYFIFCLCVLFQHLFLMHTRNQNWKGNFLRNGNLHLRLYVLIMSGTHFRVNPHPIVAWVSRSSLFETVFFWKKTALNSQISSLNNIGFSLFKHLTFRGSKFLHFTQRGVLLISAKMLSMEHWAIKAFPVHLKDLTVLANNKPFNVYCYSGENFFYLKKKNSWRICYFGQFCLYMS